MSDMFFMLMEAYDVIFFEQFVCSLDSFLLELSNKTLSKMKVAGLEIKKLMNQFFGKKNPSWFAGSGHLFKIP